MGIALGLVKILTTAGLRKHEYGGCALVRSFVMCNLLIERRDCAVAVRFAAVMVQMEKTE